MKIEGGCHCGDIAYQAEIDPNAVRICHCTDCQNLSGSAYRANVPAPAETFVLLKGEPKTYIKTAESGARRVHAFCGNCGTPIYAAAFEDRLPIRFALALSGNAPSCIRAARFGAALHCPGQWT